MGSRYEREVARHRAIEVSREAQRREREDRKWREQVLSAEERSVYGHLEAAGKQPTRSLERRATWPMYPLLFVWVAAVFVVLWLMWPMVNGTSTSTMADRVMMLIVLFGVLIGGGWAVGSFGSRRAAAARTSYADNCAQAIRDFLKQIDYPERLRKAKKNADDESRDWDGPIRLHQWR